MRILKNVLVAMLISLSTCSTACTKETLVPVAEPAPKCNPGQFPQFPQLAAEKCSDGEVELVCLTPADAAAIWAWARETGRWAERVQVCQDTHSLAFTLPTKVEEEPLPAVTRTELDKLAKQLLDPRLKVSVVYEQCGHENAYYHPVERKIVICTEMLKYPAVRFFLAHEIAHAYIVQLEIPFTGSHEAAADELATVLLLRLGRADAVADAALYWAGEAEQSNVPGFADHPDHDQRFWTLSCLTLEATGSLLPAECRSSLQRVQRTWAKLLK